MAKEDSEDFLFQDHGWVVRRAQDGGVTDITPSGFNARTRVHEYGRAAYTVHKGTVYFSNFKDQRLYRQTPGSEPQPITPEVDLRYADAVIDDHRNRLICVREDHTTAAPQAVNTIVGIDLAKGGPGHVLVYGNDFYSTPRLSPDESRLAWLTWYHPNMPWDGTEFWVAEVKRDGSLGQKEMVAGGATESIFQPEWSPEGALHFVSDKTGWWNMYRWRSRRTGRWKGRRLESLPEMYGHQWCPYCSHALRHPRRC